MSSYPIKCMCLCCKKYYKPKKNKQRLYLIYINTHIDQHFMIHMIVHNGEFSANKYYINRYIGMG